MYSSNVEDKETTAELKGHSRGVAVIPVSAATDQLGSTEATYKISAAQFSKSGKRSTRGRLRSRGNPLSD